MSHQRFIGAEVYCGATQKRVKLHPDHQYGDAFVCPGCSAEVPARKGFVKDRFKLKCL